MIIKSRFNEPNINLKSKVNSNQPISNIKSGMGNVGQTIVNKLDDINNTTNQTEEVDLNSFTNRFRNRLQKKMQDQEAFDLASSKFITDVQKIADATNDKSYFGKNITLNYDGNALEYSKKVEIKDETYYCNKTGEIIKIIHGDGSVAYKFNQTNYGPTSYDTILINKDGSVDYYENDLKKYTLLKNGALCSQNEKGYDIRYLNGDFATYDVNGKAKYYKNGNTEYLYSDDGSLKILSNNTVTEYYSNGSVKSYRNGNKTTEYDQNNNVVAVITENNDSTKKENYKDGKIVSSNEVFADRNEEITYTQNGYNKTIYDKNGKKNAYIEYSNGRETKSTYNDQGLIRKVEIVDNGKIVKNDEYIYENSTGKLASIKHLDGSRDYVNESGKVNKTVYNDNSEKEYDDSGNVSTKKETSDDGNIVIRKTDDGKVIENWNDKTFEYYDNNGNITEKDFYLDNNDRVYIRFDENGNKNGISYYNEVSLSTIKKDDGTIIYSDSNGNELYKINSDGTANIYDFNGKLKYSISSDNNITAY